MHSKNYFGYFPKYKKLGIFLQEIGTQFTNQFLSPVSPLCHKSLFKIFKELIGKSSLEKKKVRSLRRSKVNINSTYYASQSSRK